MSEVTSSQNVNSSNNVTGGVDYDSGPYTVTFTAGETRAQLNIPLITDNLQEANENFRLIISRSLPTDVTRSPVNGQSTVTIVDDDRECQQNLFTII